MKWSHERQDTKEALARQNTELGNGLGEQLQAQEDIRRGSVASQRNFGDPGHLHARGVDKVSPQMPLVDASASEDPSTDAFGLWDKGAVNDGR